jgi:hypothetical protein
MKTLREYIDQLDEISRRDFLKGAGATAGLAAMGAAKDAKADWNISSIDDPLTGEKRVLFRNASNENPKVELTISEWENVGWQVNISPVPLPEPRTGNAKIGRIVVKYSPFRMLIGKQLYNNLNGGLFASSNGIGMILSLRSGLNSELFPVFSKAFLSKELIKIEISDANRIYSFNGRDATNEEINKTIEDDLARILEISKYK